MTSTVTFASRPDAERLRAYLQRASTLGVGSVRIVSAGGVLAVYALVLAPVSLIDRCPTVLGVHTAVTTTTDAFDLVVPLRSLRQRLDRLVDDERAVDASSTIGLPLSAPSLAWSTVSLPRGRWRQVATVRAGDLQRAAREGIRALGRAHIGGLATVEQQRERASIWGAGLPGLDYLPVGAAYAAHGLGLLEEASTLGVHDAGPWLRLAAGGGYVLARQPNWSLRP